MFTFNPPLLTLGIFWALISSLVFFPLNLGPPYLDKSHQCVIHPCPSRQEEAAPRAQFMEEEELLCLFRNSSVTHGTKWGRGSCSISWICNLLPTSPSGSFTPTPLLPISVPSQCAGGPVTLLLPSILPRPSAPLLWGRRSLTPAAVSLGHLKTSTGMRSSMGGQGSQREDGLIVDT